MNKVMRYQIIKPIDVDWNILGDILRKSQRETREIMNKTIQLCWEWDAFCSEYKAKHSEYPKPQDIIGFKSIDGHCYNVIGKNEGNIQNTQNISQAINLATQKWKTDKKKVFCGQKSIASFKNNNPINIHNKNIKIYKENGSYYVLLSLVNNSFKKQNELKSGQFLVLINEGKSFSKEILDRCVSGEYGISASQILSDDKKWYVNVSYSFEPKKEGLNENKILGIDMGVVNPIYMAVNGEYARASIGGTEIIQHRKTVEARYRNLLRQSKYCGNGRIGHGIKKRISNIEDLKSKIANFRDTINHKYSKFVIDFAVKNNCGTIQMEDLSEISKDNVFLKSWTYFDLQTKITYKAKEMGIKVINIDPSYTSQRCNKCGKIDKENRKDQSTFECIHCGYKTHADLNAALNIGTPNIENLIKCEL